MITVYDVRRQPDPEQTQRLPQLDRVLAATDPARWPTNDLDD